MREELSSLDLMFLKRELSNLVGGRIQKVFQHEKEVRLEIFLSGVGTFELYFAPGRMFVTEYKRVAGEAEAFAMNLRKNLSNQRITAVRQPGFERIIEVETESNILIFELFSKGNVILCSKDYMIIMPLEVQLWRDRQIKPRVRYVYPPAVANPFALRPADFSMKLSNSDKPVVRLLAVDLSFSGLYAEELCSRAGIEKNKHANALSSDEKKALFSAMHEMVNEFEPQIVFDDGKPVDVVPIRMKAYEGKKARVFSSFTTALDEYFTHKEAVGMELEKRAELEGELGRLQRIEAEQKEALEKWKLKERESRKKAEAIYNSFGLVQKVIDDINRSKESGMSWDEIRERLKKEVKEIKEKECKVVLSV
ncbi:MAG: NFACT family protein [Candidatus Aenigmatarchaeota archaeon]